MGPAPVSWQSCWRGSVRECGPDSLSVAVVERVDSCASMYSRSIQGHHVCLLVKKVSSQQHLLLSTRGWLSPAHASLSRAAL